MSLPSGFFDDYLDNNFVGSGFIPMSGGIVGGVGKFVSISGTWNIRNYSSEEYITVQRCLNCKKFMSTKKSHTC